MILGDNGELAKELRAFANLVEAYPELKVDKVLVISEDFMPQDEDMKNKMGKVVRALKRRVNIEKKYYDSFFDLKFKFGKHITYRWTTKRNQVCEARVIGQEYVPPQTVGGYTKDVVEWDCDPLLKEDT